VIVDGAGIIRAFGPPHSDGSSRFPACIGSSLFETFPELPRTAVAESIAATLRNGRLGPRQVMLDPADPFGPAVEVSGVEGQGQVIVRWVGGQGLDALSSALSSDLTESQTLEVVARFLAARLAPALTLGLLRAEGTGELQVVAQGGRWFAPLPPLWVSGALERLMRTGGVAEGLGGDLDLGPEEKPYLSSPWVAVALRPKDAEPGLLVAVRSGTRVPFGAEGQAILRTAAVLAEMGLGKARLLRVLTKSVFDTVNALAVAIEAKDPYTEGHVQRVTQYALALGEELGLPEDQLRILQFGAILHDVGKIGIRAEILNKVAPLEPKEIETIRAHPLIGEQIIRDVDFLQPVRAIIRHHQERYDGSGYPEGLRGEAIPILARVVAVADAYDAISADRPYRKSLGHRTAARILREGAGHLFDPRIVEAFLRIVEPEPGEA
jgi:hypothetical protein